MRIVYAVILGTALDFCFGDPYWMPHPICLIGKLISRLENAIRRRFPQTEQGERRGGILLAVLVCTICFTVPFILLMGANWIHPWFGFALETFWCYQIIAAKCLKKESMKVYAELKKGDLAGARRMVGMIVGRDTGELTEEGVCKAAVETVAENTADGVVAPLLYMAVGGAALGFLYKAVNTMDSMIGYKNEKYLHFGRFAAKLDDVLNYIPARVCAILMILSSFFIGLDGKNAWRVYRRDRHNHASPNSAQTESVCAGALGIQLAGNAYYFGRLYEKPTIGDHSRDISCEDIRCANRLMFATSALAALLFCGVRWAVMTIL